jgi:hypothetical protein
MPAGRGLPPEVIFISLTASVSMLSSFSALSVMASLDD